MEKQKFAIFPAYFSTALAFLHAAGRKKAFFRL